MSGAFLTLGNRNKMFALLTLCGLFTIGAAVLGIDDNPPGILFAYLAAFAFVLAFAHPWQTARPFVLLLLAACRRGPVGEDFRRKTGQKSLKSHRKPCV